MPTFSKEKRIIISNNTAASENSLQAFTKNHTDAYYWLLNNQIIPKGEEFVDDVVKNAKGFIFPVDTTYLENYFDGYIFEYIPFRCPDNVPDKIEGFWQLGTDNQHIKIFYNNNRPLKRQLFTKIHETMHFRQTLDMQFINLIDYLKLKTSVPQKLIEKLIDKSADKATAMYLMPTKYFLAKCKETTNVRILSDFFNASPATVRYRFKECGIQQHQ